MDDLTSLIIFHWLNIPVNKLLKCFDIFFNFLDLLYIFISSNSKRWNLVLQFAPEQKSNRFAYSLEAINEYGGSRIFDDTKYLSCHNISWKENEFLVLIVDGIVKSSLRKNIFVKVNTTILREICSHLSFRFFHCCWVLIKICLTNLLQSWTNVPRKKQIW